MSVKKSPSAGGLENVFNSRPVVAKVLGLQGEWFMGARGATLVQVSGGIHGTALESTRVNYTRVQ